MAGASVLAEFSRPICELGPEKFRPKMDGYRTEPEAPGQTRCALELQTGSGMRLMVDGCVIHKSVDNSNTFQCRIGHARAEPKSDVSARNEDFLGH